ncbi:MAG: hypothetical protein WC400_00740 [Patescibacteria group bacterium]|jgi:hypothetical protein
MKRAAVIVLIVVVLAGIFLYIKMDGPLVGALYPVNSRLERISDEVLGRGWYYGSLSDKKPGTPINWRHGAEGSRSAMWYDPNGTYIGM